jgi:hypothetical protein
MSFLPKSIFCCSCSLRLAIVLFAVANDFSKEAHWKVREKEARRREKEGEGGEGGREKEGRDEGRGRRRGRRREGYGGRWRQRRIGVILGRMRGWRRSEMERPRE